MNKSIKLGNKIVDNNNLYFIADIGANHNGSLESAITLADDAIDAGIDVTYDVFKVGVYDGEYLSEDFFFCRYLREMDYKILVDPSIPTRHNGNYVFAS